LAILAIIWQIEETQNSNDSQTTQMSIAQRGISGKKGAGAFYVIA